MPAPRLKNIATAVCIVVAMSTLWLVFIELGAFLVLRTDAAFRRTKMDERRANPYYRQAPWADTYWREFLESDTQAYRPYVIWRRFPYAGTLLAVGSDGLRRTLHSDCDREPRYTIAMFGGSGLWGMGAPDAGTIPSFLAQRYLEDGHPVCVRNYAENGWVSTQQVIELLLELREPARRPDLVIFYDGVNDINTFYWEGVPGVHSNFRDIKQWLEDRPRRRQHGMRYLLESNTALLLQKLVWRLADGVAIPESARLGDVDLAAVVVDHYVRNLDLVQALAAFYNFEFLAFPQPAILVPPKPLTADEERIRQRYVARFPELEPLFRRTYDRIRALGRPEVVDIADVFADYQGTTYVDPFHLTPEGNRLVAERMYEAIRQRR